MTYHDELMAKPSHVLYTMVVSYRWGGGDLEGADLQLYETMGETHWEDESHKDALVELVERLHNDDLI